MTEGRSLWNETQSYPPSKSQGRTFQKETVVSRAKDAEKSKRATRQKFTKQEETLPVEFQSSKKPPRCLSLTFPVLRARARTHTEPLRSGRIKACGPRHTAQQQWIPGQFHLLSPSPRLP